MSDIRITLGIPNTLPPLSLREVRACLWLGFTGLLLLALALFPEVVPSPWGGVLVLVCWLALPIRGLFSSSARQAHTDAQKRMTTQVRLYTFIVVGFGVGFTFWAWQLGLSWRVVIGGLFLIESLPSIIVSFTEWWRLSTIGLSAGLMFCGFSFPLVEESKVFVIVGAAVCIGSLLSAAILYWQLSYDRHQAIQRNAS